jgi:hypothetical protein
MIEKYDVFFIFVVLLLLTKLKFQRFCRMIKNTLVIVVFFAVFGCSSKTDPTTGEKILIDPNPNNKAREFVEKGGGIFGNIGKDKSNTNYDFATSNILWRATIKSLDFMPMINADYSGGMIIYDWYSENINSNEQIKIQVRFLSSELRSESIQIIAHKKICAENEKCKTSKADEKFSSQIKESILTSARILRIEEAKKEKKIN